MYESESGLLRTCEHEFEQVFRAVLSTKKISYHRLHGLSKRLYKYIDNDLVNLKDAVLNDKCEEAFVVFNNLSMRDDALLFRELI